MSEGTLSKLQSLQLNTDAHFDSMRVFKLELEFWALIAMKWSDMVTVTAASMCSQRDWNESSQTNHLWLPLKDGEVLSPQA